MVEQFLTRLSISIDDIDFLDEISHYAKENGYALRIQKTSYLSLPVQIPISVPEKVYNIWKNDSPLYDLLMINKLEAVSDDKMSETHLRDQILIRKSDDLIVARNIIRYDEVSNLQGDIYSEVINTKRGSEFDRMDPFGKYLYEVIREIGKV